MESLESVAELLARGDRASAKRELLAFLEDSPDHLVGWKMLASLEDDHEQQVAAHLQVLRIAPEDDGALEALRSLARSTPIAERRRTVGPRNRPPADQRLGYDEVRAMLRKGGLLDPARPPGLDEDLVPPRAGMDDVRNEPRPAGVLGRIMGLFGRRASTEELPAGVDPSETTASEIIQLAGGPLPVEERRPCPECGATVSRSADWCEWCGTRFEALG